MTVASVIASSPMAGKQVKWPADQATTLPVLALGRVQPSGVTADPIELGHFPEFGAGQIWVIEISPADELSTRHRTIMTDANVIIYDHALEAVIAEALPLGGYAEPEVPAKTVQRCVQFAREGWSVARLVDRQTTANRRLTHLRELAEGWQRAATTGKSAVFVSAGRGEGARCITPAGDIDRELAATIDQDNSTVVFAVSGPAIIPAPSYATANGLAG